MKIVTTAVTPAAKLSLPSITERCSMKPIKSFFHFRIQHVHYCLIEKAVKARLASLKIHYFMLLFDQNWLLRAVKELLVISLAIFLIV